METKTILILLILFIHWVADFVLQTDEQAKNKSKSFNHLVSHTIIYSACWVSLIPWLGWYNTALFVSITFFCHTVTDYFTSRLNSKLWQEGKVHNFFVSIGFDQLLHFTQLIITFSILYKP
jgi:membrane-bound metal-dependent hydrolase YbcI (DUF457 family)